MADMDIAMPARLQKPVKVKKTKTAIAAQQYLPAPEPTAALPSFVEGSAAQEQERKLADETGLIDTARALFMHQGISGAVLKRAARDNYDEQATPGFTVPEEVLAPYEEDQRAFLLAARSQPELDRFKWELDTEAEDMKVASRNGTAFMIAAGIFGGFPEGAVTGTLVSKTMALTGYGAIQAARAGQAGRAGVLSMVENVGGNVAFAGVEDLLTGRMSVYDYVFAAGAGGIFGGLQAKGLMTDAAAALQRQDMEASLVRQAALVERARNNVGDNAPPEVLRTEMDRLEAEAVREDLRPHTSEVGADRQLLPDMEKLEADEVLLTQRQPDQPDSDLAPRRSTEEVMASPEAQAQLAELQARGPGLHAEPDLPPALRPVEGVLRSMVERVLPGRTVVFGAVDDAAPAGRLGSHIAVPGSNVHIIRLRQQASPNQTTMAGVHEVGHAIEHAYLASAPAELRAGVAQAYQRFREAVRADPERAASMRMRADLRDPGQTLPQNWTPEYINSQSEFLAEQFAKYIGEDVALGGDKLTAPQWLLKNLKEMFRNLLELFSLAKKQALLGPEEELRDFFDAVFSGELTQGQNPGKKNLPNLMEESRAPTQAPDVSFLQDPIAVKYGLDALPVSTPGERAQAKAILDLYRRADNQAAPWNNIKPEFLASITSNSYFDVSSTSLTMLKSENPVMRMVAAELIESPTGATGRRTTAAIQKWMEERKYLGNTNNEVQDAYVKWRNATGGSVVEDYLGGEKWRQFNRLVAEEIEARQSGTSIASPESVRLAADSLEKAYERMRLAQVSSKTLGWAALPDTSRGYMPHRMSGERLRNASNAEVRAFHSAMVNQFVEIEGFDISFSDKLATKYLDTARKRALKDADVPANVYGAGAADIVKDALTAMGMSRDEVHAMMGRYMKGGPGHTKKRLRLDLRQQYSREDGSTFTLLDLFETDQLNLLKQQAQRVSGEVALSRFGIQGRAGLDLLKRAMQFGDVGTKAQMKEFQAFDQVAAEMIGDPYGDYGGPWLNRAMQATSLSRLGGMGFTQFAEYINFTTGVGVGKMLEKIGGFNRLRAEAAALARGEQVENSIIGSLEKMGGFQFGTDSYKMVMPFADKATDYSVHGAQTATMLDRLLKGGLHAQGKLSAWRAIHAAQQRGAAEAITAKALEYIRAGKNDKALQDMGFTPELQARIKADLDRSATFRGSRLESFDISKMEDTGAANAFVQSVLRGSQQIIQGTFIGETGKWAHEGWLKMLTQFRTFSITSVEKQWGRQRANHGVAKATMMLMGAMSVAAPIYVARMYAQSIGRPDQQEWLDKKLETGAIARATLNYVAMSGLLPDFLDALSAVSGKGKVTGGRQGGTTEFVGTVVAPSVGLVDDVWRSVQNAKEGTDPHDLVKALPFSKLPFVLPAINAID